MECVLFESFLKHKKWANLSKSFCVWLVQQKFRVKKKVKKAHRLLPPKLQLQPGKLMCFAEKRCLRIFQGCLDHVTGCVCLQNLGISIMLRDLSLGDYSSK